MDVRDQIACSLGEEVLRKEGRGEAPRSEKKREGGVGRFDFGLVSKDKRKKMG